MDDRYDTITQEIQQWSRQAIQDGWLHSDALEELAGLDETLPKPLFAGNRERPLTVGLFGGTGVGKSTLLNRLASEDIARTGVERPTSREITLYIHQDVDISKLDDNLPLENHRISRHANPDQRDILWVDMPDMDSTAEENHLHVQNWLPHIDVVLYVVNPERYRDQRGWSLLQKHGHQHAWLFVMNQWDRGEAAQLEDFESLLSKAGFEQPMIYRTDCRNPDPGADDFARLQQTLRTLANVRTIEQLDVRGIRERMDALANLLGKWRKPLGSTADFARCRKQWQHLWQQCSHNLLEGMEWPARQLARYHISTLQGFSDDAEDAGNNDRAPATRPVLWDDWADDLLQDSLDQILLELESNGLSSGPLRAPLQDERSDIEHKLVSKAEKGLRHALANPGSRSRRLAYAATEMLTFALPIMGICWAGYQVLTGYYISSVSDKPYLGTDFAVHSILLIGLSWLLPWYIGQRLRPSLENSATQALVSGLRKGLAALSADIEKNLARGFGRRDELAAQADRLISSCRIELPNTQIENPTLLRMLPSRDYRKA